MKVPTPRKMSSGNYYIRLRLGGQAVSVTAPTEKECTRKAGLLKSEYLNGKRIQQVIPQTLGEIIDSYISKVEPVLSPSTVRGYNQIRNNRFKAYMARSPGSINYQGMINAEFKSISAKTLKNAWGLVKSALSDTGCTVPTVRLPQVPDKEIPFLQPEEIPVFCEAVSGDIAEIALLLELHGMRRSEVKGLDWKDVNLKQGTIRIHSSRVQNKDGDFVTKDTNKNRSSSRIIPIMIPQLMGALEKVENKSGPVVAISENAMLTHAKWTCERTGITVVGNHGLRHSFASLGYHLGLSVRQLMELGGWADYNTMQKIYIRLAQSAKDSAPEQIKAFFQKMDSEIKT